MDDRFPVWRERLGRGAGLAALLAVVVQVGCGREDEPRPNSGPASVSRRVASLSPLATGLLLELDLADRIVAVDAESGELPGLGGRPKVPATEEPGFLALTAVDPDLVVIPDSRAELAARLSAANIRTVIVAVHDFDDVFTLWGELAGRLGVAATARTRISEASRPFAQLAAESYGFSRPRVAALESFEPLALVGDHQFATALIEIAGGESVTHGGSDSATPIDREGLRALAPELLVHVSTRPIAESERRALADALAEIAPLVVVELDPSRFHAAEAVEAARSLRKAIAARARPVAETP